MFTKKDYQDYFKSLKTIEDKMVENMEFLCGNISDIEVNNIFDKIRRDEIRHSSIIAEILTTIEK